MLFPLSKAAGVAVYKNLFVDVVDTVHYFNLLALSGFSWYNFKVEVMKQTAIAYTSIIITFILLVGVIIYHVYSLVRRIIPQKRWRSIPWLQFNLLQQK